MSNLTKALAVVSLLAPATGLPLSIGDIELHSALNQNLNAEIRLHVSPGENPADVSVRLAPPEKFDQAGIPWSYFLTKIKFESVVQANGTVIVKVTSKETLTEPFLDFLLEVSWPQGSQFREFTLLIDPPASYEQPVIPVAESSGYRVEPLEEIERPVRKATRPAVRKAKSVEAASDVSPQTPTSGEYGPTQRSDTLWSIATRLGSEHGVPAKQMLTALYKANPEAFNRNDMDSLKAGVTLKIPETEAILKPADKQALPQKTARKEPASTGKPLELVAPVESKVADNAVVTGQVKPGQDTGAAGGQAAAGEAGKAAEGKDLELQARIDKLEQQLGMMQQLLVLKDQQLATLQNTGKPAPVVPPTPEAPAEPVVQPPSVPAPQPPVEQVVPQPVVPTPAPVAPVAQPAPQVQTAPVAEEEGIFASDSYFLTVGGLGAGILGVLGWLLWRRRRIEEQTNTESMFASASQIRMPDSESSLSVPVMELGSSNAYDVGTVGESSFISDFTPSDFDAFDTDQSEVDPLSEADVYLAYGRYQQAEELIRHAIDEGGDRDDFKLKLLEIFYAGENKEGFAAYAQELAEDGKQGDRAFWTKVSDMAKEIVPDLPLFGGTPAAAQSVEDQQVIEEDVESGHVEALSSQDSEESEFGIADDDLDNLSLSAPEDLAVLNELNAEFSDLKLDFSQASTHDDNSLDFDLGSSADSSKESKEPAAAEAIETIDFDLGGLSFGDTDTEQTQVDDSQAAIETFDFNFDVEEPKTPAADDKAETVLDLDLDQPLNLETYDFSSFEAIEPEEQPEPEIVVPPKKTELLEDENGEFDFNFDFDAPVVESNNGEEFDLSVSDLTDMDEFETKIDLAKAYVDMGDAEAARSIAEEVLSKGSKEQKVAAQALLDELK